MQLTGHRRGDTGIDWRIPNKNVGNLRIGNCFREWLRVSDYYGCAKAYCDMTQVLAMSYEVNESGECERWRDLPTSPTPKAEFLKSRPGLGHCLDHGIVDGRSAEVTEVYLF